MIIPIIITKEELEAWSELFWDSIDFLFKKDIKSLITKVLTILFLISALCWFIACLISPFSKITNIFMCVFFGFAILNALYNAIWAIFI